MAAENEWFFAPVDVYGPLGSVVTVTAFNTLPEAAANTWVPAETPISVPECHVEYPPGLYHPKFAVIYDEKLYNSKQFDLNMEFINKYKNYHDTSEINKNIR